MFLHWNSFVPRTRKRGTLWAILIRTYIICSTKEPLQNKLKQIENKFIKINGYPKWVFNQVDEKCRLPRNPDYGNNVTTNNVSISTTQILILPYKAEQGQKIIKSVNNFIKRLLPKDHSKYITVEKWAVYLKSQQQGFEKLSRNSFW